MKYTVLLLALILIPLIFAQPTIHQVLYDAEGADAGKEFIEIYTEKAIDLEEYALYTSSGESWNLLWNGSSCIICTLDSYISFGNENTTYPIALTLQNTKGAVQLKKGNEVIDTVGYGDITANFSETIPATDVASGKSLLRTKDTNNNELDFISSEPELHSDTIITIQIENSIPTITGYEGNTLFVEDENGLEDIVFVIINNEMFNVTCTTICESEQYLQGIVYVVDKQGAISNSLTITQPTFKIEKITQAIAKPGKETEIIIDVKKEGSGNITLEVIIDSLVSKDKEIAIDQTTRHVIGAVNQSIMLSILVPQGTAAGTYMGRIKVLQVLDP